MDIKSKLIAGFAAALPLAAMGAFIVTAPPQAEADCGTGCYDGNGYVSCGKCENPGCQPNNVQQCINGVWVCGCS
jgi:hypothetical protein